MIEVLIRYLAGCDALSANIILVGDFIDIATTNSMRVTTSCVESVISLETSIFHVTSTFDKKTLLADLMLSTASEELFGNPFLHSDLAGLIRYNIVED